MKTKGRWVFLGALSLISLAACGSGRQGAALERPEGYGNWYEIFVASFSDSDGDGMGDIRGLIEKLDYLNDGDPASNTSLHIDGIWLMPIMPSPSYHKYDVSDYYAVDPAYGSMADFEALAAACGERGITLIIDLVMNHSSSAHPWFAAAREEARQGEGPYLGWYNISDTDVHSTRYYPLDDTGLYYEGAFWEEMPDLNFDNPAVREEFQKIAAFWLDKGVGGFRLDAVKYLDPDREKSIEILNWFTGYCVSLKPGVSIVAEVWSDDAEIMAFYQGGAPSLFNFGLAGAAGVVARAVNHAGGEDFARNLVRWDLLRSRANPAARDAPFIGNHDTDRPGGFFGADPVKEKLAAALYLFMPGAPFIYYGEETGMEGAGVDENKRGPMIWSLEDKTGQTRGPDAMTRRWDAPAGVAEQLRDEGSVLRYYIEAIRLKNRYPLIYTGTPALIDGTDRAVAAFTLSSEGTLSRDGETIALLHNLSGTAQVVTLPGAKRIGGFLRAEPSETGRPEIRPEIRRGLVEVPAYTMALVELN
ncbi:MAG: hypothetical protein LBT11_04585 [Treponema sp.]|jgi:glycosidase|nr:hypothetical protein [Treponema sp.]